MHVTCVCCCHVMINYRGLNEHTGSAVSCVYCDRLIVPTDGNQERERERETERA